MPWYDIKDQKGDRHGKFGQIVPQDEFIALLKIVDAFDLVHLSEEFISAVRPKIEANFKELEPFFGQLKSDDISVIDPKDYTLTHEGKVVGYVKRAHDVDPNLNSHVMAENLVVKASGVISALEALRATGVKPEEIDYVVECSEEACGDINQRGGGNFAKAIAEVVGLTNATGSDLRGFCAAPTHALINASALVKAGVYKNVLVVAGGASAKLGMNAKDHVKKGLPVLEDVVGGFAVVISENDGKNPIIRTDLVGKHDVGTGSSPQAVMGALVAKPLEKANLSKEYLDLVLLIGGSSYNPYIQRALRDYFGDVEIEVPTDLQAHVSIGAGINSFLVNGMGVDLISPIVSEPILIILQNEALRILVKEGTQIPCKGISIDNLHPQRDGQKEIEIPICVSNKDKILSIAKIQSDEGFNKSDNIRLECEITHDKLVHFKAFVRNTQVEVEPMNPFANRALTTEEIAEKVGTKEIDKNMIDFRKLCFGFSQLHLRSLAAVYQKMPLCHFQNLCRRRGSHGRYGRIKT